MDQHLQALSNKVTPWLVYLDSHFSTFGWVTLIIFFVLLLGVLKFEFEEEQPQKKKHKLPLKERIHNDFNAIAGEDLIVTQLDIARAYIEMDNKDLAKQILQEVMRQGNVTQQKEAERLLECV